MCTKGQLLAAVSSSIDGFVCLSVSMSVCVSVMPFLPCSHHWIFIKLTPDIDLRKCLWHIPFQVKNQRSRSQWSFEVFVVSAPWLRANLTDLLYSWHKYSPWHCDVSWSIYRSKGQRSRSHQSSEMKATLVIRSFCRVHSVALSLFGWITSYVAYIQHMKGWCVVHHFQDEILKVKVTWVVQSFYCVRSVAPSLFHWFTSYEIYTQPMRSQCVLHPFHVKRSKVKFTRVTWSFVMSAPWLPPYLNESLHMWHTYNTWRGDVLCTISRTKG